MKRVLFDIAALIARVTLGVIFVAHGWQKWQSGLDATTQMFTQVGVPQPELAAGFTTVAETVGGVFLILGLLVRLAALVLLVVSIGAIAYVHSWNGIFIANNGWEFVASLSAGLLLFLVLGGGRVGIDGILRAVFRKRADARAAEKELAAHAPTPTPAASATSGEAGATPGSAASTGAATEPETSPDSAADSAAGSTPGEGQRADVPRQPAAPKSDLNDEDMKAIDALVSDKNPDNS